MTKKLVIAGGVLATLIAVPPLIRAAQGPPLVPAERDTEILSQSIRVRNHSPTQHFDQTRQLFVVPGYYVNATLTEQFHYSVVALPDAASGNVYFSFKIPDDWVALASVKVLLLTQGSSGDFVWNMNATQAAEGEDCQTHGDFDLNNIAAVPASAYDWFSIQGDATILAEAAAGDYVGVRFWRDGADPSDTLTYDLYVLGLLLTYTGEQ